MRKATVRTGIASNRPTISNRCCASVSSPGVHVIDVPIDYSDNERVLNREISLSAQL